MVTGETGGIEVLNREYAKKSRLENMHVFFWNGGKIADEMRALGYSTLELNASKLDFFGPLKKMLDFCRKKQPDVIIVHYVAPVLYLYALLIRRKYPRIQLIAYIHESVNPDEKISVSIRNLMKSWIVKCFLNKADYVITISEFVKKFFIKKYQLPETKIQMIYNGVDLSRFCEPLYHSKDVTEMIYVGRLIKEKGVQNILRTLAALPQQMDWHLNIVGDGEFRKKLEELTADWHLESKVDFLGERQDVASLLSQSEIFLHLPQWQEGFGIAVVEAMAAGLVCVCAKSGAIAEIISHEEDGYLIEDLQAEKCAEQLMKIIKEKDCEKVQKLRSAAMEKAKAFSIEVYTNKLDDFLSKNMTQEGAEYEGKAAED